MAKLLAFAQLTRINMSILTVSVPLLGGLAVGHGLSGRQWLWLGVIGLCAHVFGFALNDLIDQPLDRTVPERADHPLASGKISRGAALALTVSAGVIAIIVYVMVLGGPEIGLSVLAGSMAFSAGYNAWSKWRPITRIVPEMLLAASVGMLCLVGVLVVDQPNGFAPYVFAACLSLLLLLLNSVPSGLKDLKTDAEFGAESFVIWAGAQMIDDDQMVVPTRIWVYGFVLQTMVTGLIMALAVLYRTPPGTALLAVGLSVYAGLHLRMLLALKSFASMRQSRPLLSGYFNFVALCLTLFVVIPIWLRVWVMGVAVLLVLIPMRLIVRLGRGRVYQTRDR